VNTVPEHFVKAYSALVITKYHQAGGKLIGIAGEVHDGVVGETDHFDLMDEVEAQEKTTQFEEQTNLSPEHSRRFVHMRDFWWNAYIDKQDKLRLLADPQSKYVQNAVNALGRKGDRVIYNALRGGAWQGKSNPTQIALPSSQKVAVGAGPASVEKVMDAAAILNKNEVPMENRYLIVNWAFLDDMLREQKIGSVDYNNVKALMNGTLDFWMGFKWLMYNYDIDSSTYYALACHPSAIGLSRAASPFTSVDILPTKHFLTQVYASMSLNALRLQEKGVVEIAHTHA
jgi:hypothetical protein